MRYLRDTMCGRFALLLTAVVLTCAVARAVPPGDVPPDARFEDDALTWSATPDATHYNIYLGTDPRAADHACHVFRTLDTQAVLPDLPGASGLLYVLVSAVNDDGEGQLGETSFTAARPNDFPCDRDGDLLRDAEDNCPDVFNPSQADQDDNGVGDRCDPNTYDFEADTVGMRPSEMTPVGGVNPSFAVRDVAGDLAVAHDDGSAGRQSRFDRLAASMPQQDTIVYVDYEDVAENATLELWSDSASVWNGGAGVILQLDQAGDVLLYERNARDVPVTLGPPLPASGRIRATLLKGPGTSSSLHVDAWDGSGWQLDHGVFFIDDDRRYRGLDTVVADWRGGRRGLTRVTVVHRQPLVPFTLAKHASWSTDWKVFQRDAADVATIPVRFLHALDEPGRVEARVIRSATRVPVPGHDWGRHELALAADPEGEGWIDVADVPAGGNYDVELRLVRVRDSAVLGGAFLSNVAVGDVYLASGQSNMAGWSGSLADAEAPIDEVHLFHNDGRWMRAVEPMDDSTEQVDHVSIEAVFPQHSPMLRFAKDVFAATGVPVGVIPSPLGGSNLFSQWQRDAADHANRGTLYGSMLHRSRLQGGLPPRGLIWFQGESDAWSFRSQAEYEADFEQLLVQVREDLGAPDLPVVAAQLGTEAGSDQDAWLAVQEAQRQVARRDARLALITTVDQPRADGVHFDNDGYKEIGARFAQAALALVEGRPVDHLVELVQARNGAAGEIELVYDADVTGGDASLYRVADSLGTPAVVGVGVAGGVVTVTLDRALAPPATITYGYGRDPAGAWVKDLQDVPVPCFLDVSVTP